MARTMLDDLISRATLAKLSGATAFRRGEEYFSVGAIGRLRATDDKISAKVEGTRTYQVELRGDDGDLTYDCTCPRAATAISASIAWRSVWRGWPRIPPYRNPALHPARRSGAIRGATSRSI